MKVILKFNDEWVTEYGYKGSLIPAWIYLEHQGEFYPDNDWIDNPTRLLGWWLYSIEEILLSKEGQGFSFMEGPFHINVHSDDDNLILESEDKEISWVVNKLHFAKELVRAANQASRKFNDFGFNELSENLNMSIKRVKVAIGYYLKANKE